MIDEIKILFKLEPFLHFSAIVFDWCIIASMIYFCISFPSILLYIISVIIIGARMHGLSVLVHDTAHYRAMKNRTWSDRLANLYLMYPIFTSIESYRRNHFLHHSKLNTNEDPDWTSKINKDEFKFPQSKFKFLSKLASYFFLYQGVMDILWLMKRLKDNKSEKPEPKLLKILFYIILFGVITFFNLWLYYILFWIVPFLTTFLMFQYIRSVSEHFGGLKYDKPINSTRTVIPNLIEKFFIAPHNVHYHLEHHLYVGVPFYNLEKLHKILMKEDEYKKNAHVTVGYVTGLLNELKK